MDRDAYSTTTREGNSFRTLTYPEQVNFKDDRGEWAAIDRSLVSRSDGSVRPAAVDGDVSIPSSLTRPVLLEHDGRTISFRLLGADANADRDVSGSRASFDDAVAGVDVAYKVRPNGLKELITLAGRASRRSFSYDVRGDADLDAKIVDGDLAFSDAGGAEQFRVAAPLAWDSADPSEAADALTLSVAKTGDGQWRLTMRADDAWLDDPARVYPVTLDPDYFWIDGYMRFHGANQDCYMAGGSQAGTPFCASSILQVGFGNSRPYKAVMKFNIAAAIPANATATASRFLAWQFPSTAKSPVSSRLRTVTSEWDNTATWDVRKTNTAWTTKGGDVSADPNLTGPPITIGPSGYWSYWNAPLAAVNGWIKGTLPNYGFQLSTDLTGPDVNSAYGFTSTDGAQESWPALEVTWHTPDTTAPTVPNGLALGPRDPDASVAAVSFAPGTDPANGTQIVTGVNRTELRHRIGSGAFTSWTPTSGTTYIVTGVAEGAVVGVEARTIDNAGNVSAIGSGTFTATTPPNAEAFDAMATEYVQSEYGYSAAVAQQWINTQAAGGDLNNLVAGNAAVDKYAGMWFENETRTVHVNVTNSSGVAQVSPYVSSAGIASSTQYHVVGSTAGQLEARSDTAQLNLDADVRDGWVRVSYSPAWDGVEFEVAAGAPAAALARVNAEAAQGSIPTRVTTSTDTNFESLDQACKQITADDSALGDAGSTCDPPFRGGMKIFDNLETEACTLGPVVRSQSDDAAYVMTAGHCGPEEGTWHSRNVTAGLGEDSQIGAMHNSVDENKSVLHPRSEGADTAIIRLSGTVGPWIYTERSTTGSVKRNEKFLVTAMRTSLPDQVLCIAGGTSGSHCGRVPKTKGLGHRRGNAGYIRMCATPGTGLNQGQTRQGDSGAPFFAKTAAGGSTVHGTLIGNKDVDDQCFSEFQSLKAASDKLNVYVLTMANQGTPRCSGDKEKDVYGTCQP